MSITGSDTQKNKMDLPNSQKKAEISVVLGSYNRLPFLKKTIESVRNNRITIPYEIIVVDGGSTDGTMRWLAKQKDIITIIQHNHGKFRGKTIQRRSWGYFMNLGFKCAQGKYLVMISDDCLVVPDAIMNGYADFEQRLAKGEKIGALAFYWRNWPRQKNYLIGKTFGGNIFVNHGMYLKSVFEEVGGIEEDKLTFYYADSDLSLKMLQAGYRTEDCPTAFIEHFEHASRGRKNQNMALTAKEWDVFINQWESVFPAKDYQPWQEMSWDDEHQTVQLFPKRIYLILFYRHTINNTRALIKKILLALGFELKKTK